MKASWRVKTQISTTFKPMQGLYSIYEVCSIWFLCHSQRWVVLSHPKEDFCQFTDTLFNTGKKYIYGWLFLMFKVKLIHISIYVLCWETEIMHRIQWLICTRKTWYLLFLIQDPFSHKRGSVVSRSVSSLKQHYSYLGT